VFLFLVLAPKSKIESEGTARDILTRHAKSLSLSLSLSTKPETQSFFAPDSEWLEWKVARIPGCAWTRMQDSNKSSLIHSSAVLLCHHRSSSSLRAPPLRTRLLPSTAWNRINRSVYLQQAHHVNADSNSTPTNTPLLIRNHQRQKMDWQNRQSIEGAERARSRACDLVFPVRPRLPFLRQPILGQFHDVEKMATAYNNIYPNLATS
jgi:hypothetical protein